ncbi:MAG TPA: hypothetical protein VHP33_33380 [Polyangiaceae bacterium]|nr:hypothetical protein [Polyangiaceae bacterium]
MLRTSALWLCLPLSLLLASSCGSDGDSGPPDGRAGNGGEPAGNAGEPNTAASSQGAASSNGGSGAGNDAGDNGGHAGAPMTNAGAPTSGSGGAQGGASPDLAGAAGAAGANEGGAPPELFGDATHGEPCPNGDECAKEFICVGFGNPLPNGESTACATKCTAQTAQPGCDCLAGYCWGGLGLYDFTCDYPLGTPCNQSVFANDTKRGQITGVGEITPGYVYVVSLDSQADVDLEVCGSTDCQGDNLCVSGGATGSESCIVQATKDSLDVYVVSRADASSTVKVNVEADYMTEYKLSYTQMGSSLGADRYMRLLVTGLTPGQKYDFNVATANARDINLKVTSDLHGEQVLCDEDLVGTAAACELTVTQAAVWAVLTDTSGIGDAFTFKVTAK